MPAHSESGGSLLWCLVQNPLTQRAHPEQYLVHDDLADTNLSRAASGRHSSGGRETSPQHRHQERQKRTWSNDQLVTSLLVLQEQRSNSVPRGMRDIGDQLHQRVHYSIPLFLYIYIYTYTHTSPTPLKVV